MQTAERTGTTYNRLPVEAQRLGVCQRTLVNWIAEGIIPHRKSKDDAFAPNVLDGRKVLGANWRGFHPKVPSSRCVRKVVILTSHSWSKMRRCTKI